MGRLTKEYSQENSLQAQLNEDVERAQQAIKDAKLKLEVLGILSHVPGFPVGKLDRGSFRIAPLGDAVLVDVPISTLDYRQCSVLVNNLQFTPHVEILIMRKGDRVGIKQLSIRVVRPYQAEAHDETSPVGEIRKDIGTEIERRTGRARTKPPGCGGSEGEGL